MHSVVLAVAAVIACVFSGIHIAQIRDHFESGNRSTQIRYEDGNMGFRVSETLMFVFGQVVALIVGNVLRAFPKFLSLITLGLWVTQLVAFIVFSYGGMDKLALLLSTGFLTGSSGLALLIVMYLWWHGKKLGEPPQYDEGSILTWIKSQTSLLKVLTYLYIGVSLVFLNDIIILDELGIVDRQVEKGLVFDDIILLADQHQIMMFVTSQISLFVLGLFYNNKTHKPGRYFGSFLWIVILGLELGLVLGFDDIDDVNSVEYLRLYTANAVFHFIFAATVAVLVTMYSDDYKKDDENVEDFEMTRLLTQETSV
jgi:hypothetical protein